LEGLIVGSRPTGPGLWHNNKYSQGGKYFSSTGSTRAQYWFFAVKIDQFIEALQKDGMRILSSLPMGSLAIGGHQR